MFSGPPRYFYITAFHYNTPPDFLKIFDLKKFLVMIYKGPINPSPDFLKKKTSGG